MLPEYQRKTNIGVGIGFVLQVIAISLVWTHARAIVVVFSLVITLISIPVFTWGCMNYVEGKGHSKWVGLVGLAGLIGLMVLIVLPGHNHDGSVRPLQVRRLIAMLSILLGLGVLATGRWLDDLEYASIFNSELNVRFEFPWPAALMFLGTCLIIGSLILLLVRDEEQ